MGKHRWSHACLLVPVTCLCPAPASSSALSQSRTSSSDHPSYVSSPHCPLLLPLLQCSISDQLCSAARTLASCNLENTCSALPTMPKALVGLLRNTCVYGDGSNGNDLHFDDSFSVSWWNFEAIRRWLLVVKSWC